MLSSPRADQRARTAPRSSARKPGAARGTCAHCAGPTPSRDETYCCEGCRHVHELLQGQGLARYYELRHGAGVPVLERPRGAGAEAWIDAESEKLRAREGLSTLDLDVEGIHCTGCVWLIEEVFRRSGAEGRVRVNPALGSVELTVARGFGLRAFYDTLLELGYRLGPHKKDAKRASDDLIWRMGVCVAIAMNAMIFAIARYAGLEGGSLERVFLWLELGLAIAAFLVGGIVFVRAAWRGLRRRVVHLDLPIAVGLILGYAGSFAAVLRGDASGSYFDTLIVFTTLMLVGRFLRERVLEKNRSQLLEDAGFEGVLCRRVEGDRVEVVPVSAIRPGDKLLIAPGDVLPVESEVLEPVAFSFDWVTGESEPRAFEPGAVAGAGAANAASRAVLVSAKEAFSESRLVRLLRAPRPAARYGDAPSPFEARIATIWVPGVLAAAAAGFALHVAIGSGVEGAIGVAVAVLVVTCPCAFGIATPIAHELVLGGLRKLGLLVRSPTFLERATTVRRVVFDKTGTLTRSELEVATAAIGRLEPRDRDVLYNLVSRSSHPKAAALRAAMGSFDLRFDPAFVATETPGRGLEAIANGATYRLEAPKDMANGDVAFLRDGADLATFRTSEVLRSDAPGEVAGLTRDGCEVWMATGDNAERAMDVASRCGIDRARVLAGQSPEDKASLLSRIDRGDTLMIGDGVNDGPAVLAAHCSGTPSAGRAFLASRADFYLLSPGLGPVRKGLAAAHALRRALERNLVWAVAYNAIALTLAFAGLMTPLLCALLMPASSLVSIALVVRALGPKGPVWRS